MHKMKIAMGVMILMSLMPFKSFAGVAPTSGEHSVVVDGEILEYPSYYDVIMSLEGEVVWMPRPFKLKERPVILIENNSSHDINLYLDDITLTGSWTPSIVSPEQYTDRQWKRFDTKQVYSEASYWIETDVAENFIKYKQNNYSMDWIYKDSKTDKLTYKYHYQDVEDIDGPVLLGGVETGVGAAKIPTRFKGGRNFLEEKYFDINIQMSAELTEDYLIKS